MPLLTIIGTSVGLAMDAFAVSMTLGCQKKDIKAAIRWLAPLFFGVFQSGMTLLGWAVGGIFQQYIYKWSHWAAFALLSFIGGKMIWEYFKADPEDSNNQFSWKRLIILSFATSIDALAVGLSIAFLNYDVLWPSLSIGVVTYILSEIGVRAGFFLRRYVGPITELFGGIVLIGIGVKILIEHFLRG